MNSLIFGVIVHKTISVNEQLGAHFALWSTPRSVLCGGSRALGPSKEADKQNSGNPQSSQSPSTTNSCKLSDSSILYYYEPVLLESPLPDSTDNELCISDLDTVFNLLFFERKNLSLSKITSVLIFTVF